MRSNLTINGRRLWDTLMETAAIGGTEKGGVRRLTLTDEDRRVRDWFRAACEALGCTVTVDSLGNMFAMRPGADMTLLPIAIGSHLDTQPTGGKFDGILGVLGGLEVLRTLHDAGYETRAPLVLVNWTNEEGSRFSPAMVGSGVHAGVFSQGQAEALKDREGTTLGAALDAIGYRGPVPAGQIRLGAYFELHIEQGPILDEESETIGVVTGVQGMKWFDVSITCRESHAGTTPMPYRRDALAAFAEAAVSLRAIAHDHAPHGLVTIGIVEARPGSPNIIPGEVRFTLDLRHPKADVLQAMTIQAHAVIEKYAADHHGSASVSLLWDSPPVAFDPDCIGAVRDAAQRLRLRHRDMISGAGHDAAYTARIMPTAMIFVPCKDGLSHNEAESATQEDCADGTQVLLEAVLAYDNRQQNS